MSDFSYKIHDNYDHIIEEYGNTFIALRLLSWGDSDKAKLDLRKYYNTDDGERVAKGVSFSREGADELTRVLVSTGYGDTEEIITSIKDRDDFMCSLSKVIGKDNIPETNMEIKESDYFDPSKIFEDEDD